MPKLLDFENFMGVISDCYRSHNVVIINRFFLKKGAMASILFLITCVRIFTLLSTLSVCKISRRVDTLAMFCCYSG